MLCPDLTYESDQSSSEGAEGRGRRTFALHITPVNFGAHVVVASGILRMRQAISAEVTSPVPFIPIRGPRLPKILAHILYQECLCNICEGKCSNIFHSHQLLVKFIVLVPAVHPVEILDVRCIGGGNACLSMHEWQSRAGS